MYLKTVTEKNLSLHRFTVKEYHRLGELGILHEVHYETQT
jgi:hypothetical protein